MKKRNYLLLLLCITSLTSFAQLGNWVYDKSGSSLLPPFFKLGHVEVDESGITLSRTNHVSYISFHGEKKSVEIVPEAEGLSFLHNIYTRQINGQTINIKAIAHLTNKLILKAYDPVSEEEHIIEITDALHSLEDSFRHLFLIEADNGDFIIFGQDNIETYRLLDDLSWTLVASTAHSIGDISHVIKTGDNFLVSTPSGELNLLNTDFESSWAYNANHPVAYMTQSAGGFAVCGTDLDTETAFVSKINTQGDLVWQEDFNNRHAYSILALDDALLIGGLHLYAIDNDGAFLWDRSIPSPTGIFQMVLDPYDGVILKEKRKIYRVDLNRSTRFEHADKIHTSQTEAHISNFGNLNYDNTIGITYPLDSETAPIFANAPLFTALTEHDSLVGFLSLYDDQASFKSLPQKGPISDNQLWKITQKEIDILQERFNNGEDLAPYSHAMLTYPALGNPHCTINGVAYPIEEELAPFVDVNGDGIYNIFDGDYPEMKGDEMIWWAKHNPVNELDIHGRWYVYNCGDHLVSKTVYVEYTVVNQSEGTLNDCRFGNFVDWDLGCHTDDLIGSLPTANAMYAYNEDAIDGTNDSDCILNLNTYDEEIPVHSLSFLGETMASAMFYNNGGMVSDLPVAVTDPGSLQELYYYMRAAYRDGTPLTRGGSGYNPSSSDFTNYVFPDNPSDPTGWSMLNEDLGPKDVRALTASSSFELAPGASRSFSFSFTTHPDIPLPAPDVSGVEANILAIDDLYQAGNNFAQVHLGQDIMMQSGENIELDAGDQGATYLWSTGETTATININTPGTYAVTLTDNTGCERTDDIVVELATTNTEELVDKQQLVRIYPNPMGQGNTATIELEQAQQIAGVNIFNTLGQQVSRQIVNDFSASIQVDHLADLAAGIYVIEVIFDNKERQLGKLVIE